MNYLQDLKELNSWIKLYNREKGRVCTPVFHRSGQDREGSAGAPAEPVDAVRARDGYGTPE